MIRICQEPFDPGAEIRAFEKNEKSAGAIVTFVGKVRGEEGADPVKELLLEHFPGVTEGSIAKIERDARRRWNIDEVLILHRVGRLRPSEPIVLVCVSAAHRRDTFLAADFVMDYLKTQAFFWKKERRDGGENWVEPRRDDYLDAERWASPKET